MKNKINPENRLALRKIIEQEMQLHGEKCDLNHIDVSQIIDMTALFYNSPFNGNISGWDVSSVINMNAMFYGSQFNGHISGWDISNTENMEIIFKRSLFNGDISGWNTSNVENMQAMFEQSQFNNDISGWDVSNVKNMCWMFRDSKFNGDISNWNACNVLDIHHILYNCPAFVPYWAKIKNFEDRVTIINNYHTKKLLEENVKIKAIKKDILKI